MSYNYSIKSNNHLENFKQKNSEQENQNNIYVFEIKIVNFDDNIIKKKLVSLDKHGELLECKNNIKKIKIVFCYLNSMEIITLKKTFTDEINETIALYKNNIVIYFNKSCMDNININYQII